MIGIIDYGVGNVKALMNVYNRLNIPSKRVSDIEDIDGVDGLILPGVGHFDHAMKQFDNSGLRGAIEYKIFETCTPILGICVGMQMLTDSSEEGERAGLGWIPGCVMKLENEHLEYNLPLPHMGWNSIHIEKHNKLISNATTDARIFYFLHSYYFLPDNESHVLATCKYGVNFSVAVANKNILGVQFHPEKSHSQGVELLSNYAGLCKC
jgi:imidazole glycerol-phosphate synthase subunit HisH